MSHTTALLVSVLVLVSWFGLTDAYLREHPHESVPIVAVATLITIALVFGACWALALLIWWAA